MGRNIERRKADAFEEMALWGGVPSPPRTGWNGLALIRNQVLTGANVRCVDCVDARRRNRGIPGKGFLPQRRRGAEV